MPRRTIALFLAALFVAVTLLPAQAPAGDRLSVADKRNSRQYLSDLESMLEQLIRMRESLEAKDIRDLTDEEMQAFLDLDNAFDQMATDAFNWMNQAHQHYRNNGVPSGRTFMARQMDQLDRLRTAKHSATWDTFVWVDEEMRGRREVRKGPYGS